jgi:RNA-directed DNA polymerase
VTDTPTQHQPALVPFGAKQAGETRGRRPRAEAEVWTERMLTALEQGVKGNKWFSLVDKVYTRRNLQSAFAQVRGNKGSAGVDHQTVEMFGRRLDENLAQLSRSLADGSYRPQAIRRVEIPKAGSREKRPLGIPTVRDRVAQTAIRNVLEPIFERDFAAQSYGFRPGRGCKDALRRVESLLKEGYRQVVDADLKRFFDTIPHERIMAGITAKVTDGRLLSLIEGYLTQTVLDGLAEWTPDEGTPQGAVLSPLLANISLDPLDHQMARAGYEMVRYADDFVILCRTREEAERALSVVAKWTAQAGLTLHPDKTRIADVAGGEGFDFLGYRFGQGRKWPRKKSIKKLRDAIREKTKRTNGKSLEAIIQSVKPILRGWFEYFKHAYKSTFQPLDGWVRMRLRSILRKRKGRKGRGRGKDQQRWPNAFFEGYGLYSLATAHIRDCQSLKR